MLVTFLGVWLGYRRDRVRDIQLSEKKKDDRGKKSDRLRLPMNENKDNLKAYTF
jgi:hypothetical protein